LVHECIHALGIDYQRFTRQQAEVIVDTTTLIVLGGVGLASPAKPSRTSPVGETAHWTRDRVRAAHRQPRTTGRDRTRRADVTLAVAESVPGVL